MRDREPTVRSRALGDGLRQAMEYAGLSAADIARRLDWSPSRVSRLLAGKRGGSGYDVSAFAAVCGVRGRERDRLMALSLDQNRPGWFQQHGSYLPTQVRTLIDHEDQATEISTVELHLVPGLLQTGDYARRLISGHVNVPPDEVDDRVSARLGRQELFSRQKPPRLVFYLHEFVFHLPIGGREIMSDQLHQLLRMSVRPHVSIRVIPAALGRHPAFAGSFVLMKFAEIKPVTYLESETSSLFLELPIEIDAYGNILAALAEVALSEGQSRALIGHLAAELYADRGDYEHT